MTRDQLEALIITADSRHGRASQQRRVNGIEAYLLINGPYLTRRQAAQRLGVSEPTITRYRRILREAS